MLMMIMLIHLMWNTINQKRIFLQKLSIKFDYLLQQEIYVFDLYNHAKAMLYYVDHQEI